MDQIPWEGVAVLAAIFMWVLNSIRSSKNSRQGVIQDAMLTDELNRARQSAADKERARVEELEAEIRQRLEEIRDVEDDPDGAAARLSDEFGG